MSSIWLLILLGLVAWFWFDTLRSQEIAKAICKQVCAQLHLQLLDDTITLVQVRLKRNCRGRLHFQRVYQFEFSDSGQVRYQGVAVMRGSVLEMLELPGYLERTISPV
jgi:hypothetical protein